MTTQHLRTDTIRCCFISVFALFFGLCASATHAQKATGAKQPKATKTPAAAPTPKTAVKPKATAPTKPAAKATATPKATPKAATTTPKAAAKATKPSKAAAKPKAGTPTKPAARRPVPRKALSPKARCIGFFRARLFRKAGECFAKLGMSYGDATKLKPLRRYEKGQFLRNAAVAFEKEALLSNRVEIASWLRERAVALLKVYQREKLCENNYRCRIALDLETRIAAKIGYVQLTVVVNHSNGLGELKGFRHRSSFINRTSIRVRPGKYTLKVSYPKEKKPRMKSFSLPAGGTKIISVFPKIKQRLVSKVSLGLYIASGLLLAGGGTMTGIGAAQWYQAEQEWAEPTTLRSKEPVLVDQRKAAQPLMWVGAGAAGAGVVLLIMGFAFHKPPPPPPPKTITTPTAPSRKAASLHVSFP